jgi:hypothetical protein
MANPLYEFWYYQQPSGPWVNAAPYGTSNTFTWTVPTNAANGTVYSWQAWMKDAGSTAAYDTYAGSQFTVGTGGTCSSLLTNESPSFSAPLGTQVTFTSGAAGCSAPQYSVYYQPPNGPWTQLQPYSSSSTYTWDTTGALAGTYLFQVWARQAGNLGAYDTFDNFSYALTGACTGATATVSPAFPAVGDTVTITGNATCSGTPTYQCWLQPPGGAWQMVQDYSTNNVCTWSSAGGTTNANYNYEVWVRSAGSTAAYDTYASGRFSLSTACTSTTFAISPSTAVIGSQLSFSGIAAGCDAPGYELWMLPPGGAWTLLDGWTNTPSGSSPYAFQWTSAGSPGTYAFQVWARGFGSTDLYQTYAGGSINLPSANLAFGSPTDYATGVNSSEMVTGDFNGDGKIDIAAVNHGSNNVSVLLGNGGGTFQAATNYAVGNTPYAITSGDFNGDGKRDLAVANFYDNDVSVLLGKGDGTFQAMTTYGVGAQPYKLSAADFNGDGKSDLAVANYGSSSISVLLASGAGGFQPAVSYATCSSPEDVEVGDLNGDGKPDLVVPNPGCSVVGVYLALGNGSFQAVANYAAGGGPFSAALGDFNGDGKLDVAMKYNAGTDVAVLPGNGSGALGFPITSSSVATQYLSGSGRFAAGDLNGDGKLDLVGWLDGSGGTLIILIGNGDGTFAGGMPYLSQTSLGGAIADFNGNGKPDIVVGNNSAGTVTVLLQ